MTKNQTVIVIKILITITITIKWWHTQVSERLLFTRPRARTSRNICFSKENHVLNHQLLSSHVGGNHYNHHCDVCDGERHVCSNIWTYTAWNKHSDGTKKWFQKYLNKCWNKYWEETKKLLKLYFNFISISTMHIHNLYQQGYFSFVVLVCYIR